MFPKIDKYAILKKYYRSWTNMLRVIKYRGLYVENDLHITFEEFCEKYENWTIQDIKEDMSGYVFGQGKKSTLLFWFPEPKISVSVRDTVIHMENNAISRAILIADHDDGMTAICPELLKSIKKTKHIIIDVWTLKESLIFAPDHRLVPQHRIISKEEGEELLNAYAINKDETAFIEKTDVIVKYLGALPNQMIEIIRPSISNPDYDMIKYRVVK